MSFEPENIDFVCTWCFCAGVSALPQQIAAFAIEVENVEITNGTNTVPADAAGTKANPPNGTGQPVGIA